MGPSWITRLFNTHHVPLLHAEVYSSRSSLRIRGIQLKCSLIAASGSALIFYYLSIVMTQKTKH